MTKFIYIMSGLFVISLAMIIGSRLSTDAMAVIIGIICGMITTVPTVVLLIFLIRQKDQQHQQHQNAAYHPPVVVVNGQQYPYQYSMGMPHPPQQGQNFLPTPDTGRSFKVVGQEASSDVGSNKFSLNSIWEDDL